jgi:hypothetical protein
MSDDEDTKRALAAAERLGYNYARCGEAVQVQHEAWATADSMVQALETQVRSARQARERARRDVEEGEAMMTALIASRQQRRDQNK